MMCDCVMFHSGRSESADLEIILLRSRGTPFTARMLLSLVVCELRKALSVQVHSFVLSASSGPSTVLGIGVHKSHQMAP